MPKLKIELDFKSKEEMESFLAYLKEHFCMEDEELKYAIEDN